MYKKEIEVSHFVVLLVSDSYEVERIQNIDTGNHEKIAWDINNIIHEGIVNYQTPLGNIIEVKWKKIEDL